MARLAKVVIGSITVTDRVRQRADNLDSLKRSIEAVGLLQPIVVDDDHRLVSGWRRLRAVTELGHEDVPAYVVSSLSDARLRLIAERDENTCREPMNGMELTAISKRLLALEAPAAKQRQLEGQRKGGGDRKSGKSNKKSVSETVSQTDQRVNGEALQHVAAAVQVSAPSLRKAFTAFDAYESNPEKFIEVKPALEAKQWSKAQRIASGILGGETDRPKTPKPRKPVSCEQLIHRLVHAIRTAVADWPRSEPFDELIAALQHEAGRLSERQRERVTA